MHGEPPRCVCPGTVILTSLSVASWICSASSYAIDGYFLEIFSLYSFFQFCILFKVAPSATARIVNGFPSRPSVDHICDHIDIAGFRKKDNIRAARYTCMKRYTYFVSITSIINTRLWDASYGFCQSYLSQYPPRSKSECHFCSPQIVIDRLRKRDHIQSLFPKKTVTMRSVSS